MPRPVALILALVILAAASPAIALAGDATPAPAATPATAEPHPYLTIHAFTPGTVPEISVIPTLGTVIAVQPGDTVVLVLGRYDDERCGVSVQCFIPVQERATWSVVPGDIATIDPASGELAIDAGAASGSQLSVSAEVEDGRYLVTTEVSIYTPEANPLVGFWREEAQLSCENAAEVAPALPIEELVFAADGQFAVTWQPFESYVDYWGTYAFALDAGTVTFAITSGNFVPGDPDGQGRFKVDEAGDLLLIDLWLGTSHSSEGPANCGHRFTR